MSDRKAAMDYARAQVELAQAIASCRPSSGCANAAALGQGLLRIQEHRSAASTSTRA